MKLYFAFLFISLVLVLVYAAPTTPDDPLNTNCFSLTYPVNGTVWENPGSHNFTWITYETCEGVYNVYLIPTTKDANGAYFLGEPYKAIDPVDLSIGYSTIILDIEKPVEKYVFVIAKDNAESMDYTDLAVVDIV
ncbi:hypothetical protein CLU79DRAFT_847301 [Phycomyces nitens]|nr:hypothetical protein CLU79DRAFT_847301 [Phycomyces nitens]